MSVRKRCPTSFLDLSKRGEIAIASRILDALEADQRRAVEQEATRLLGALIQEDQYVGEQYSISYENALVQIHDRHRMDVGGIPGLSFLVASRIKPDKPIDYTTEDASVILLRVMDAAPLPNASEAERIRVEAAQRATGEERHWDEPGLMDGQTANLLSYAGVKCRVIGTFYLDHTPGDPEHALRLRFGSDISNYYPNRGLKVYKPNGPALSVIVNYRDPDRVNDHPLGKHEVNIGEIRYASTNRPFQGVSDVRVHMAPADLLDQKTALFGMTRTGKSNTTKIIAKSVFELRFKNAKEGRIGQIIFDYNGEYANENVQDPSGSEKNPSALKNVWRSHKDGHPKDVVTYGTIPHPDDPDRKMMKLNFFAEPNLQIGKEIINGILQGDYRDYIKHFIDVGFVAPDSGDQSGLTRYRRRVLAYHTLLVQAGFDTPNNFRPNMRNLFSQTLLNAMQNSTADNASNYQIAANVFGNQSSQWSQLAEAFEYLEEFIRNGTDSGYNTFNQAYRAQSSTGENWAESDFIRILGMFRYKSGPKLIGKVRDQHSPNVGDDYADDIYKDLEEGKLVIVDQSSGEPDLNHLVADRVMWAIFRGNQNLFSRAQHPPKILVYIEEAHNLLPSGSDVDMRDVWVRTAKEGAKLGIGMVYATQEVSSIQKNILKNTANWFIGHLNNTDETKELCKYYDFADFEPSIRRAQDRGFLRVKTLSNLFVIPVQIDRFVV